MQQNMQRDVIIDAIGVNGAIAVIKVIGAVVVANSISIPCQKPN